MRHRVISIIAVVAAFAAAGTAEAAKPTPKPVCNLITDAAGDSQLSPAGGSGVPGDGSSDIVSADVASNAKTLTGVIRLAGLQNPDPESPFGQAYYVYFLAPRSQTLYFLTARLYPTGAHFYFGYEAPDPLLPLNTLYAVSEVTGVVDTAHNQVRISAPLATIAKSVKLARGAKLTGLDAKMFRVFGQGVVPSQNVGPGRVPFGGLSEQMDDATSTSSYVLGTSSCVRVGK